MVKKFYRRFGGLYPASIRALFEEQLKYSGEKQSVELYLGSSTVVAFLVALILLVSPAAFGKPITALYIIGSVAVFCGIIFFFYVTLYFKVEDRSRRVEEVLPDVLQLIAANVRAGMTPFQALRLAARKEFGPLYEEIRRANADALGTVSFSESLLKISKRVRSETLERALSLFTTAMHSGGHLATLLEDLAQEIEDTESLKRDLVTGTKAYTAFIMFSIIIGTPLLLAVSIQFLDFIGTIQGQSDAATAGFGLSVLAGEIAITSTFLTQISVGMLLITSLLASILLGVIREGKFKFGLKYAPIIAVGSLSVFFLLRRFVSDFFGSLI